MPRPQRPPLWLARFLALLVACVLVGQSLLGAVDLCAVASALGSDCCQSPYAGDAPQAAGEKEIVEGAAAALEAAPGTDSDCSCPFDCARGCCSPNRAIAQHVVTFEHTIGDSEQLELTEVDQTPSSPDARGILHVPKRAA